MPNADPSSSPVRLVVSDVDGTLLDPDKNLSPRARDAVARILDAGIAFTIVSARPPRGMKMFIDALRLSHPVAAFNGGMLVRPDLSILQERLIPEDAARRTLDILASCGAEVWLYSQRDWYVTRSDTPRVRREEMSVRFAPTIVTAWDGLPRRAAKLSGVSDDPALMDRCEREILRQCGGNISATLSQADHLDVTHPQANKGEAVKALSALLNVPLENVATIGDGPNDVSMFRVSGLSIAMANAAPETRQAARLLTLSNQEDGFAEAIDRYILSPSR